MSYLETINLLENIFTNLKEIMEISQLIVKLAFKLKNLILFFTSIMLQSQEFYKNGKFFKFIANTLQNKKEKYVKINVDSTKKQLLIDGSSYKGPTSLDSIVGTWWNHEIVKAKAQISAVSGRIIEQKVTF